MPSAVVVALGVALLWFVPAQTKQAARVAQAARTQSSHEHTGGSIGVQTGGDACQYLTPEECCGQMLEVAGFSALGGQLPRLVKTTVRLTCEDERKVVRDQVCRSILMTRGFSPQEVAGACKPGRIKRECRKDEACNQCTRDLRKLDYRGAQNACHAVTYNPAHGPTVVRVGERGEADGDTRFRVTRRRRF